MGLVDRLLSSLARPKLPDDLQWLTPDVAHSERFVDAQASGLTRAGIRAVLDIACDQSHSLGALGKANLHYLHIEVGPDATPAASEIARVGGWVRHELDDDRKVLIHCVKTAAATMLIAAALVRCGHSLDATLDLVEAHSLSDAQLDALTQYATQLGK